MTFAGCGDASSCSEWPLRSRAENQERQADMAFTISRRTCLGGASAAIAAPFVLAQSRAIAAADLKFALPWIPHGGYAFLFAAKKLGLWSNGGLNLQIDRGYGSGETCKRVALG